MKNQPTKQKNNLQKDRMGLPLLVTSLFGTKLFEISTVQLKKSVQCFIE